MHDYDDEFDMMNDEWLIKRKFRLLCFIMLFFIEPDRLSMPLIFELGLLFADSFILNDGFLNLTLLRRINFDFPVLPVTLPGLCGAIDTKENEYLKYKTELH